MCILIHLYIYTYGLGIYQGFTATLLRNVPCFGAYFFGFEATKQFLTPTTPDLKYQAKPSLFACFIAGGVGGFSFWGTFYPLETIKTRLQVCVDIYVYRCV